MFQLINNFMKSVRRKVAGFHAREDAGQVAVILILVTAIALIFLAVALNLGRVTQNKNVTVIAANSAASILASQMTGYGQQQLEQTLGGVKKVCGPTILGSLLDLLKDMFTSISWKNIFLPFVLGAMIFVAVIQNLIVQPGLTDLWNDQLENLSLENQFLERGIQTALTAAVSDNTNIEDIYDFDLDTAFGFDQDGAKDEINRFGYYYSQNRIKTINPPDLGNLDDFINALKEFVEPGGGDPFCLFDPLPACPVEPPPPAGNIGPHACCYPQDVAQCNPCCLPDAFKPPCCDISLPEEERCGDVTQCSSGAPYTNIAKPQTNVFDFYWEDNINYYGVPSAAPPAACFREWLGRDDENDDYVKNANSPNGTQNLALNSGFIIQDTTGFYDGTAGAYPNADDLGGIFELFYKIADWGVDLNSLTTNSTTNPECHWCAPDAGATCDQTKIYHTPDDPGTVGTDESGEIAQLLLPGAGGVEYHTTRCVDGTSANPNVNGLRPLAPDKITMPSGIIASSNDCAQNLLNDGSVSGFWKRGADRFCTEQWPYYVYVNNPGDPSDTFGACQKHLNGGNLCTVTDDAGNITAVPCDCAESSSKSLWTEDPLDDMIYGIPEFVSVAQQILTMEDDQVVENFKQWYNTIAPWIEEPGNCYLCETGPGAVGALRVWRDEIALMRDNLEAWAVNSTWVGNTCGSGPQDAWCVPPAGCEATDYFPAEELATFEVNPGQRGDLDSVVACLAYNVESGSTFDEADGTADFPGNYNRYKNCFENCTREACQDMPRSMLPLDEFDPRFFENNIADIDTLPNIAWEGDLKYFIACLSDCSQCANMPQLSPAGTCYFDYPSLAGLGSCPDPATQFNTATDCPLNGSPWAGAVLNAISSINPACDPSYGGSNNWLVNNFESMKEARIQTLKFEKRLKFLRAIQEHLKGGTTQSKGTLQILGEAENAFDDFLAVADDLIAARIDLDSKTDKESEEGLPYQVIYGWQEEEPVGSGLYAGDWHLVRVDARIPRRCDSACRPDQKPDPNNISYPWPYIKTWTENWGTTRCYELVNTEGIVKVRVTRWDESKTGNTLYFPNKAPIWRFRNFQNIKPGDTTYEAFGLEDTCAEEMKVGPESENYGAFIMNEPLLAGEFDAIGKTDNISCWNRVTQMLSQGVSTETCAKYFYSDTPQSGMYLRFVKCTEPF